RKRSTLHRLHPTANEIPIINSVGDMLKILCERKWTAGEHHKIAAKWGAGNVGRELAELQGVVTSAMFNGPLFGEYVRQATSATADSFLSADLNGFGPFGCYPGGDGLGGIVHRFQGGSPVSPDAGVRLVEPGSFGPNQVFVATV